MIPGVPAKLVPLSASPDDDRDILYVPSGRPVLCTRDMRPLMTAIEDQLALGSCTAQATVGGCESFDVRAGRFVPGHTELARLPIYKWAQEYDGIVGDRGAVLRSALKAAQKRGVPYESTVPYRVEDYPNELPPQAEIEALTQRLVRYERILPDLRDEHVIKRRIKAALNDGMPVACAGMVFNWLFYVKGPLHTHPQVRHQIQNVEMAGGHAMLIVGYDDAHGIFIARNSWGTAWGDQGYYGMDYEDVHTFWEFWALRGFRDFAVNHQPYDQECAEAKAGRLYRAALGRAPEEAGLAFQTAQVERHGLEAVAGHFIASPEFRARYSALDNRQFVHALYRNVLGREGESEGVAHHVARLAFGATRAQVLIGFSESPENRGNQ